MYLIQNAHDPNDARWKDKKLAMITPTTAVEPELRKIKSTVKPSCPNIVQNGGFENGWVQPWKIVGANTAGLPGWTVTQGSIDFGNYKTRGHCNRKPCAHGGQALFSQMIATPTLGWWWMHMIW